MKIAITSQNRRTVTVHGGRCRRFWIYQIDEQGSVEKNLLEIEKEQTFHEVTEADAHPLDGCDLVITGGHCPDFARKIEARGMKALPTTVEDPDLAIELWQKKLLPLKTGAHTCCGGKNKHKH